MFSQSAQNHVNFHLVYADYYQEVRDEEPLDEERVFLVLAVAGILVAVAVVLALVFVLCKRRKKRKKKQMKDVVVHTEMNGLVHKAGAVFSACGCVPRCQPALLKNPSDAVVMLYCDDHQYALLMPHATGI